VSPCGELLNARGLSAEHCSCTGRNCRSVRRNVTFFSVRLFYEHSDGNGAIRVDWLKSPAWENATRAPAGLQCYNYRFTMFTGCVRFQWTKPQTGGERGRSDISTNATPFLNIPTPHNHERPICPAYLSTLGAVEWTDGHNTVNVLNRIRSRFRSEVIVCHQPSLPQYCCNHCHSSSVRIPGFWTLSITWYSNKTHIRFR
jgi:hypothetical protein